MTHARGRRCAGGAGRAAVGGGQGGAGGGPPAAAGGAGGVVERLADAPPGARAEPRNDGGPVLLHIHAPVRRGVVNPSLQSSWTQSAAPGRSRLDSEGLGSSWSALGMARIRHFPGHGRDGGAPTGGLRALQPVPGAPCTAPLIRHGALPAPGYQCGLSAATDDIKTRISALFVEDQVQMTHCQECSPDSPRVGSVRS